MPLTMCQMPHQAATIAMPPMPWKKSNTSTRPSRGTSAASRSRSEAEAAYERLAELAAG